MRKLLLIVLLLCAAGASFAGQPFVAIQGGYAPDRMSGPFSSQSGTVGVGAGYEIAGQVLSFAPQLNLGYICREEKFVPPGGGSLSSQRLHDFYCELQANVGVRIFKDLYLVTGPEVRYTTEEWTSHWLVYWGFGAAYRIDRFKIFLSYNQQVNNVVIPRLNYISAGVQLYF